MDVTYKAAFQALPYGSIIVECRGDTFIIIDANAASAALERWVRNPQGLIEQPIQELLGDNFNPATFAHLQRALTTGSPVQFDSKTLYRTPPASHAFHIRVAPISENVLLLCFDQAALPKQAEEEHHRDKERTRLVEMATRDAVYDIDLRSNVVSFNDAYHTLYGPDTPGPEDTYWWESRIHPNDRQHTIRGIEKALTSTDDYWTGEYRFQRFDGEYANVLDRSYIVRDAAGKPIRMIGAMTDVSELKQAQEDRRQSLKLLQAFMDNTPALIFMKDTESRYMNINRSYETYHNVDRRTFIGKSDNDLFPPELAEAFRKDDQEVLASGRTSDGEWTILIGDQAHTFLDHKFPLFDAKGIPYGVCGIAIDITERKKAEAALHELNAELEQRVTERTSALSDANTQLKQEIEERKQAEAALRESEERFRAIFEKAGVGVALSSLDGKFLQANPAFQALIGYTEQELREMTFFDITHPDDIQQEAANVEEALDSDLPPRYQFEKRYVRKNGETISVRLTASFITNDEGVPAYGLGMIEDITDQKLAKAALHESESKFRTLAENIPGVVYLCANDERYTMRYISQSVEDLTGYVQKEFLEDKISFVEIYHPDDEQYVYATVEEALDNKHPFHLTYRIKHKDGAWRWVEEMGVGVYIDDELRYLEGFLHDVTERKRAEEALRDSEEFNRRIVEALPGGIVRVAANGALQYANAEAQRILGLSFDELTQSYVVDFETKTFWEDGSPCPVEEYPVSKCLQTGKPQLPVTIGVQRPDGTITWAVYTAVPLLQAGTVTGAVVTFLDLTARKQAEAERELLVKELEAKNTELERYTYTVSHDLKSPLFTIKGFLGLLKQDILQERDERIQQDMDQIIAAADKMHQLLNELLELSRVGRLANPSEPIHLTPLIHEAVALIKGKVDQQGVRIDIAPSLPVVTGDRLRLLEVFQNLLDNAVKFMGNQPDPHIEVGIRHDDETQVLFVRDNGIGIPARYKNKVFGLFERLDQQYEGTGIGLTLVQRIVEVHGGRIWVESNGEKPGTTFCFTLSWGT